MRELMPMVCPEALVAAVTAAAVAVAKGMDTEDIELLAAVATQFGDTLATLAVARSKCAEHN